MAVARVCLCVLFQSCSFLSFFIRVTSDDGNRLKAAFTPMWYLPVGFIQVDGTWNDRNTGRGFTEFSGIGAVKYVRSGSTTCVDEWQKSYLKYRQWRTFGRQKALWYLVTVQVACSITHSMFCSGHSHSEQRYKRHCSAVQVCAIVVTTHMATNRQDSKNA